MPRVLVDRGPFPPEDDVLLVGLACERPRLAPDPPPEPEPPVRASEPERRRPRYVPLARFSVTDVCERAFELGVAMSYSTVWRRLNAHALRPWFQEQWLFPRDP
jgi:hypothetical protein